MASDAPPPDDPLTALLASAPHPSLASFTPTRLLANDREAKAASILGMLGAAPAIVRLAREPFSDDALESGAVTRGVALTPVVRNDCYLRATGTENPAGAAASTAAAAAAAAAAPPAAASTPTAPTLAVELICPASDKHIAKYSAQPRLTLAESRAAYEGVTLPAVVATPPGRTAWVDNILGGTAEADRVLARWPPLGRKGEGGPAAAASSSPAQAAVDAFVAASSPSTPPSPFVLLPDLKWDGADPARLYAVSIFGDPGLRSVRDLDSGARVAAVRAAHGACLAALAAATGTPPTALRSFFHYHPSYWRLHIHYAAHGVPASDGVGKAHAAEDVLGEEDGESGSAWAHKTLVVCLGEGDPLAAPLAAWMDKDKEQAGGGGGGA